MSKSRCGRAKTVSHSNCFNRAILGGRSHCRDRAIPCGHPSNVLLSLRRQKAFLKAGTIVAGPRRGETKRGGPSPDRPSFRPFRYPAWGASFIVMSPPTV
ncbi:hypothetical protein SI859A1_01332 [Aurantimonas manganoxydans SI85-9A1]|uniref:Uncharacterized protein n=1 Tax=Aurantimonas manganoxydans (strain ATCC BAA-1229 / DSM 21871 / SI85-9A1) TaxID=287752 RepID=Q1YIY8_AURMS|nr:hypothetical protein SI859A1_01332 [Aurantimonas manganoxydans SI85-9A1]